MAKKERTIKQDIKSFRAKQWLLYALTWLAIILPISIIVSIKWDKWITKNPNKTSVAIGGIIALLVLVIALFKTAKLQTSTIRNEKEKSASAFVTISFGWALATLILTLFESILSDLVMVLWYELIGIVVAGGCYYFCKYYKEKATRYSLALEKDNIDIRLRKERKNVKEESIGSMLG